MQSVLDSWQLAHLCASDRFGGRKGGVADVDDINSWCDDGDAGNAGDAGRWEVLPRLDEMLVEDEASMMPLKEWVSLEH